MRSPKRWYAAASIVVTVSTMGCYENFSDPSYVATSGWTSIEGLALRANSDDLVMAYYYDEEIRVARSYDNGLSWPRNSLIFSTAGEVGQTGNHLVADHSAYGTFFYADSRGRGPGSWDLEGTHRVYRSSNAGGSWNLSHEVSSNEMRFDEIKLAQNPNDADAVVYAIRQRDEDASKILLYGSSNRGTSFRSRSQPLPPSSESTSLNDLIYMDDGALILFYSTRASGSAPQYFIKRSTNNGITWTTAIRVNSTLTGSSLSGGSGDLAQAGTALHAVWGNDQEFKHAYSTDGGLSWSDNEVIAEDRYLYPDLVWSETQGALIVGYMNTDFSGPGWNYHYRIRGSEWSEELRINNHTGGQSNASQGGHHDAMVIDSNGILYAGFSDRTVEFGESSHAAIAISDPNFGSLTSAVGIQLDESTIVGSIRPGETLSFSFSANNFGDAPETFDAWITYEGETGISGTLQTYRNVTLAADASGSATYSTVVPARAPQKKYYRLAVHIGDVSTKSTEDSDSFSLYMNSPRP